MVFRSALSILEFLANLLITQKAREKRNKHQSQNKKNKNKHETPPEKKNNIGISFNFFSLVIS